MTLIHEGGGNAVRDDSVVVRRTAAIGDALAATCVADKLADRGYTVLFQTHPDIHCVLRRHPAISGLSEPNGFAHINLDGSYENDPQRRVKNFSTMFLEAANNQLRARGLDLGPALNCKPRINIRAEEKQVARTKFSQHPRPWVFVCPRSDSYNVRQVADGVWQDAASRMHGTKFWLGRHPAPGGFIDLKCQHIDNLIVWASVADIFVSVDTGPLHIAAAMGIPLVAINQSSSPELHLSDQCDFISLSPKLDCLNCQQNVCRIAKEAPPCQYIDPNLIADWVNAKWMLGQRQSVSAIVPIYKPEVEVLNRCLQCVIPQVDEVIVTAEANSKIPAGALKHPRVRYVQKHLAGIGYGRNVNFGARHSNGRYLLLMNDDVFLEPDAVLRMLECMKADVGMVSNLLFYPDKTIYHAGKVRSPGTKGWAHIDYKKYIPTFQQPTELENCCGACVLVRREAFYGINGFDEDFFVFSEDDAMALAIRYAGWKIMFTPHSKGIHMEHESIKKLSDMSNLVGRANALFNHKWGSYLEHNLNRVPGNFDYLKQ